jgi:hypothetical protein
MADGFDLRELLVNFRDRSVEFDDEDGFGRRKVRMNGRFDGDQRNAVHDLYGSGNDPRGDDLRHRGSRSADRVVRREQRLHRLGPAQDLHRDLRDNGERSLGANENTEQIRPGRVRD